MPTRRAFISLVTSLGIVLGSVACALGAAATQAAPIAPAATVAPPTAALATDTAAPAAISTTAPTAAPTAMVLAQQWNGHYTQAGYGTVAISIIVDKRTGDTFTGKMVWGPTANVKGAITKINGQFVTDFGDAAEQAKWNNVPDYKTGDKSGAWIKWTETAMVQGSGYTLGGWYYGHILENGSATGIYYLSDKLASFSTGDSWTLTMK